MSNNPDLARKVALLRDWGQESKYNHVVAGYNYRMDGIQGAVLNVKMQYIEAWTEARRRVAAHYDRLLAKRSYKRPAPPSHGRHVYHVYAIALPHRDDVQKALQAEGIATGIHYPVPVHLQKAYANLKYKPGDFPVTNRWPVGFCRSLFMLNCGQSKFRRWCLPWKRHRLCGPPKTRWDPTPRLMSICRSNRRSSWLI